MDFFAFSRAITALLFLLDVHILYVLEMAQNSRLLLISYAFAILKFSSIPFLMCISREIQLFARSLDSWGDPAYQRTS
jgi:hypothetical protein